MRLRRGVNLLRLKLVQPAGQRTRAFVAFAPPPLDSAHLGLRWFTDPQSPRPSLPAAPECRAVWLRCLAPPGLQGLKFVARGEGRVWADGQELALEKLATRADGSIAYRASASIPSRRPVSVALRIVAASEFRAGDVLPEPVQFICGAGELQLGDWCAHGLATYSGIGKYQTTFELSAKSREGRLMIELGDVSATCEVRVNGVVAGILSAPPWRVTVV